MAQQNDCELTGALSWISQTLLFLVAFVAVFFMRQKESPKRPLKVWWFDLLKQTVGTIIQHFSSLGLSLLFSGNANEDPCVWYLTNYHADCIICIFFNYKINSLCERLLSKPKFRQLSFLKSGNYGNPPKYFAFFAQLTVWSIIVSISKTITTIIVWIFSTPLNWISAILISPLNNHKNLKIFILMGIEPIIVSSLVFVVQDTLLKKESDRLKMERETVNLKEMQEEGNA